MLNEDLPRLWMKIVYHSLPRLEFLTIFHVGFSNIRFWLGSSHQLVMAEDNLLVLPPEHASNQALGKQGGSVPHCLGKLWQQTGEIQMKTNSNKWHIRHVIKLYCHILDPHISHWSQTSPFHFSHLCVVSKDHRRNQQKFHSTNPRATMVCCCRICFKCYCYCVRFQCAQAHVQRVPPLFHGTVDKTMRLSARYLVIQSRPTCNATWLSNLAMKNPPIHIHRINPIYLFPHWKVINFHCHAWKSLKVPRCSAYPGHPRTISLAQHIVQMSDSTTNLGKITEHRTIISRFWIGRINQIESQARKARHGKIHENINENRMCFNGKTTAKNPPVFLVISQAANLPGRGPSSYRGGA